jgi:hypothetical protein
MSEAEHFPEKWLPVFRQKMRPMKNNRALSDSAQSECAPGARLRGWLDLQLLRAVAWIVVLAAATALAACDRCGNFLPSSGPGACHSDRPPQ